MKFLDAYRWVLRYFVVIKAIKASQDMIVSRLALLDLDLFYSASFILPGGQVSRTETDAVWALVSALCVE